VGKLKQLQDSYSKKLYYMAVSNANRADKQKEVDAVNKTRETYKQDLKILDLFAQASEKETAKYAKEMKDVIEGYLEHSLNTILPHKSYQVKLENRLLRGANHLKAMLVTETGEEVPSKILEGSNSNLVLSFAGVAVITLKSGYQYMFYDEAFAAANIRSLVLSRKVIQMFLDMGGRLVMVSQNPMLVKGFTRNVIELVAEDTTVGKVNQFLIEDSLEDQLETDEKLIELFDRIERGEDLDELLS